MTVIAMEREPRVRARDVSTSVTAEYLRDLINGESPTSSNSWTEAREALVEHLATIFLNVSDDVRSYLRANSDVAWQLIGAAGAASRIFGPSTVVRLAVVTDVDDEFGHEQLYGYIRSALSLSDAFGALERFDAEWLLEHLGALRGRLSFDVDF